MSFVDFAELKTRVPIEDVLTWLGIETKKASNGQLRGCCPIHGGNSPREFVVTPSKGLYFCFAGCGGGDIIKLVANHRKIGTKEAGAEIAAHFGKGTVTAAGNSTVPGKGTVPQNEKAGFNPLTYLEATHEAVQALGVSAGTCGHFGAGYAPKGILRGRMAIPIHDKAGLLLAYCGRTVKGESPTLTFPNGFQAADVIFNAHRVTQGELYLVRDPLQVLTAYESGIENVVSFLTEAISAQQLEQLASLMDEKQCESAVLF
ncbi:CHC2 zinc finger domain-containing protein [Rhodoferax sp.]|uniref:CHC2 zinc finger domain-containing protein n=1 Tax=Rhodoferax sp. TaxID=50421 RepID=UPI0027731509|nr:CHC2 zinc finger domain-containing protein [Rhodoferax sp.]